MSVCTSATSEVYTTATMLSPMISQNSCADASGNIGSEKRRKPYPPILSSTPARITDPAVGASTCASGSQVCTGHIGILTANDAKNARNSQVCACALKSVFISVGMSVVRAACAIHSIAISISTDPSRVYRKNL